MRTFISIDIPEEFYEEIRKIQDLLPEFRGKKTEPENLHLTLKFLGEINDEKVEEVRKKLREIKFEKFETEIDSIGVFSEKFVRVVWLHLSNCDDLQKKIDEVLKGLFDKEKRFMSHLTIARIKYVEDKKKFIKQLKKIEIPKINFIIDDFRLKESVLTSEGPAYKTLEKYKLI